MIRPEDIELVDVKQGMLTGVVQSVTFKGVHYEMIVDNDGYNWIIHNTKMEPAGTEVGLSINLAISTL